MLVQSAGAECVHAAEAVCVTYGGQPWVWTSPKRGPVAISRDGRCQPGLTIAELRSGHVSSGRRDRSPFSPGPEPGETAPEPELGRGLPFDPWAAGAAWGLLWGSCGGTLIRVRCRRPEALTVKVIS